MLDSLKEDGLYDLGEGNVIREVDQVTNYTEKCTFFEFVVDFLKLLSKPKKTKKNLFLVSIKDYVN